MTVHRKKSALLSLGTAFLLAAGSLGANCRGIDDPTFAQIDTGCDANVAQILIMDGMSKRLCGCTEPAGTVVVTPASLTCTVAAGTKVYFHFTAARLRHQIVPVGGAGFPAGPVYEPGDRERSGSFVLDASAAATTYGYKDQFDSTITGQIVSQ